MSAWNARVQSLVGHCDTVTYLNVSAVAAPAVPPVSAALPAVARAAITVVTSAGTTPRLMYPYLSIVPVSLRRDGILLPAASSIPVAARYSSGSGTVVASRVLFPGERLFSPGNAARVVREGDRAGTVGTRGRLADPQFLVVGAPLRARAQAGGPPGGRCGHRRRRGHRAGVGGPPQRGR